MIQVHSLRCEYLNNPLGLDVEKPRINWRLSSTHRAAKQMAYQIQVALNGQFSNLLWDSHKVVSDQSVHIQLNQVKIEPFTTYFYRVKVWDNFENVSDWSEVATWETGMLHSNNWSADWITASNESESEACDYIRKPFHLSKNVKSARAYASSLGIYELHVNGDRVGDSYFTPGWTSYQERVQYQTYDITELVTKGENAVGMILGNGWYKGYFGFEGRTNIYGDRKAGIAEIHVTYENNETEIIVTDHSWKASKGPIKMSEIYFGEVYDARAELAGWSKKGFDDQQWKETERVDYPKENITYQQNEAVRKIEYIKPEKIIHTPEGDTVLDMGQNMVGWMHFRVNGNKGQEVSLEHAEILDKDGNFYVGNLRKATQKTTYILKGDPLGEYFEPHFTFQGFRYVKLSGLLNEVVLEDFTGVVLHSDMESTGEFECSNPLVNQLHHNINWGLKGNFLDVPTDCPQRDERLGWTGDAQMFFRTAAYLKNVAPFFTKWLKDLEADQLDNGGVPYVIPNIIQKTSGNLGGVTHSVAAWGDASVIIPWSMYVCYGDKRILEEQYESMKKWVEYLRNQGTKEALWDTGFQLGDWLGLDSEPDTYTGATDKTLIATAYFAYSTELLMKTAEVLNNEEDMRAYQLLLKKIKKTYQQLFLDATGKLTVQTQTAHVLTLMFELADEQKSKQIATDLAKLIEKENYHLTTGFIGAPYLNIVLSEYGYHDIACKLLLQTDYPSWLYQVTKGATTVWEHWDSIKEDGSFWSDDMNSFNHYAYGSIGEWLYKALGGIDSAINQPGYKHIILEPRPGAEMEWVTASVDSMYGKITSAWNDNQATFEYHLSIPVNTSATVILHGVSPAQISEQQKQLSEIEGVVGYTHENDRTFLEIGSGTYSFSVGVKV
ncbi:alpha-L-rhamnosidase [Gracilibacillus orientalis]|uniref:alpha-L-rhamnosidase n=1 Tax=Gracilibacillus orientalis TaxID=334253 RepID=A0A1I4IYV2_9BACI|nr:alpha-L-rhamnosidase [Gracilibacillus orientalis]SFL59578.1 alpha-L-rhamnosidase [Gracilibacillus orientalis]